jgi:hypothetical protein
LDGPPHGCESAQRLFTNTARMADNGCSCAGQAGASSGMSSQSPTDWPTTP